MAKGMETGGAGAGGTAAELAVGFGMAQQMMQQGLMKPQADAAMQLGGAGAPAPAAPAVDLLGPADVATALGVSEEDVMAVIASGELKAKKIGTSYRVTRAALDAYLAQ
jgi:excisionase family DNA binding protein